MSMVKLVILNAIKLVFTTQITLFLYIIFICLLLF